VDTLQQLHDVLWLEVHPWVWADGTFSQKARNESFVPGYRYRIGGRHKPHTIPLPAHYRTGTFASAAKFFLGQTVTVTVCICGYNSALCSSDQQPGRFTYSGKNAVGKLTHVPGFLRHAVCNNTTVPSTGEKICWRFPKFALKHTYTQRSNGKCAIHLSV